MSISQRLQKRVWMARLAIASVLFQALAFGWHGPLMAMSSQMAAGPASPIIVICSPTGVRLIILDRDGNPVELPESPRSPPVCSICLSLNTAAFAVLHDTAIAVSVPLAKAIVYPGIADAVADNKPYVRCGLDPPQLS